MNTTIETISKSSYILGFFFFISLYFVGEDLRGISMSEIVSLPLTGRAYTIQANSLLAAADGLVSGRSSGSMVNGKYQLIGEL